MEKKEAEKRSADKESEARKEPVTEIARNIIRAEDPRASQYPIDDVSGHKELPDGQSVASGPSEAADRALSPHLLEAEANDASVMVESYLKERSSPMSRDLVPGKLEDDEGKSDVQAVNENRVPENALRRRSELANSSGKPWKREKSRLNHLLMVGWSTSLMGKSAVSAIAVLI